MRIEPTTFLVLLSAASFATASLRGSGRTSRIRGAEKYDNNNGRFLQATLGEAQPNVFLDEDPNQRVQHNSELRGADDRAQKGAKQPEVIVLPRKREGGNGGKLRSRKDKKTRDAADKVYPTRPPKSSKEEKDTDEETPETEVNNTEEISEDNTLANEEVLQKEDKVTDEEITEENKQPKEDDPQNEEKDSVEEVTDEIEPPKEEAPQKKDKSPEELGEENKPQKEDKEIKAPNDPEVTKPEKEDSKEPSKKEKDDGKDEKLEKAAILAPVPKPTPFPTWTFEISSPKIAEDAAVQCEYCREEGCNFVGYNNRDVVFSQGSTATCSEIRARAQSLKPHQCDIERKTIEDTCCVCIERSESSDEEAPIPEISGRMADISSSSSNPCDFCVGEQFLVGPIIQFSSQNDSVSCGGFMSLIRTGYMKPSFCASERNNIEEACCRPISESEDEERLQIAGPGVVSSPVVSSPAVSSPQLVGTPQVDSRIEDQAEKSTDSSSPAVALVSSQTTPVARAERDRSGCDFCNFGEEYLDGPIIYFSSGNDRVSCGGLTDLIGSGLSQSFCEAERQYIEEACCHTNTETEAQTIPPTNQPTRPPTNMPTTLPPTISPSSSPSNIPTDLPTNSQTNSPTNSPQVLPVSAIDGASNSVSVTTPPSIAEEAIDFDDDDFFFGNVTGNITEGEEGLVASTADEDIFEIFLEQNETNQELELDEEGEEREVEVEVEEAQPDEEEQVDKQIITREVSFSESEDEPERKGPGKQGKPSTIKDGGKRENGPMANVDHKRKRPASDATTEKESRLGQSAMGGAVDSRQVDLVEDELIEDERSSRINDAATGGAVDSEEVDQFDQEPGTGRLGQSSMGAGVNSREVDPTFSDEKKTGLVKKSEEIQPAFNGANTRRWGARRFMGINRGFGSN